MRPLPVGGMEIDTLADTKIYVFRVLLRAVPCALSTGGETSTRLFYGCG